MHSYIFIFIAGDFLFLLIHVYICCLFYMITLFNLFDILMPEYIDAVNKDVPKYG